MTDLRELSSTDCATCPVGDPITEAVDRLLDFMASGPEGGTWYPHPGAQIQPDPEDED